MKLYQLPASKFSSYFGTPQEPITHPASVIIAQRPDCSAFLVLSDTDHAALTVQPTVPAGFDFTYCQEWGLTINDDVVDRVIRDLRRKDYGSIGDQLDTIWHAMNNGDTPKIEPFYSHIQSVKDRWTKRGE